MSQQSLNGLAPEFGRKYEKAYMDEIPGERAHLSPEDYKRWCKKQAELEKCRQKAECCVEKVECAVNKCEEPCKSSYDMGGLGLLLLWFIIFTVLFWLIFYSLQPSWVLNADGSINTGKVLLASVIAAIILVIIIWLIKSCITRAK